MFLFKNNIIIKKGKIYFIDFEYSGWDDPAKLYCDFILQPKIQIPELYNNLLKKHLISNNYINNYEPRINILFNSRSALIASKTGCKP